MKRRIDIACVGLGVWGHSTVYTLPTDPYIYYIPPTVPYICRMKKRIDIACVGLDV